MPKKSEDKKTELQKRLSQSEFEEKVIELAKKGITSEKIGEGLKKQKIHPKEYNKKISQILKEKDLYVNADLRNIEKKLEKVSKHYKKNKQDKRAMREKDRIFAQHRKLERHFKIRNSLGVSAH